MKCNKAGKRWEVRCLQLSSSPANRKLQSKGSWQLACCFICNIDTVSYFVKKKIIITLQFWTKDIALKICLLIVGSNTPADLILTFKGDPLMSTLSANLTRLGFDLSFAFLAAERRADFRLELCKEKTIIFWPISITYTEQYYTLHNTLHYVYILL